MVGLTQSAWCSSSLYIGIMDSQNSHGSMMLVSSVLLLVLVATAVFVTWPLATTTEELADLVRRELTILPEPPDELADLWIAELTAELSTAVAVVESLLPEVVPPPLLPYLLLE